MSHVPSVSPESDVASEPAHVSTPVTMHTLQIGDEWMQERPGGLQRYFSELLHHLPATGTDYTGLVVGSARIAEQTNGKVIGFAPSGMAIPKRLLACRRAARKLVSTTDLIAIHFALYGLPLLDQMRSRPTVVHFHGPWANESSVDGAQRLNARVKRTIETQVYGRAQRLIVLSEAFRQQLVQGYCISDEKVRVVPGGVDTARFNTQMSRAEARRLLGWPEDRWIVLSVRRQVRRMGLENLIEAARKLVSRAPDALFLLGGTGPLAPELQERIEAAGLRDHVRLLGRVPDEALPVAYRATDVTVVPSQALEGFGLVTLESLASGTPVLVTPVGGLPEVIRPFAPECVFEDTSADQIFETLHEFLSGTRDLPSEDSCRSYAAENFSWDHIVSRIKAVYDEARR